MKRSALLALPLAASLLGFAAGSIAENRNRTIEATPIQHPIVVDGSLADWNLEAATTLTYDDALAPRFTATLALAYDGAALYVAAHVVDDSPLVNQHDPGVDPERGWSGDALQIRLSSDPAMPRPLQASTFDRNGALYGSERIAHLTFWQFTARQEPVLMIEYGMDFHGRRVLCGKDSGVAFSKDKDGAGYTIEARIPWSLLHADVRHPAASDKLAFVVKPIWGDRTGTKAALTFADVVSRSGFDYQDAGTWGVLELASTGAVASRRSSTATTSRKGALHLTLPNEDPSATSISAAIFDTGGTLVRTLLPVKIEAPRTPQVELDWDGLDDDGRPLAPGHYTVKYLSRGAIGQRLVTTLLNAGNPSWRTENGTGSWGGEHGNPIAIASDKDQVYLGWKLSEAGSSVLAVDPTLPSSGIAKRIAAKHWGVPSVLEVGVSVSALATDGQRVFVAQDGRRFADRANKAAANIAAVVLWNAATGRPENFPFGQRTLVISRWQGSGRNLTAIAVKGNSLYAARNRENVVTRFDWTTGKEIESYNVRSPTGIALAPSGDLLVLSESSLVRIGPDGRQDIVIRGLVSPGSIALTSDGRICIAEQGDSMQVRVFDAQGKPLGAIGRKGGRPAQGLYDPDGMLNPASISIDAHDHLWVAENDATPPRISAWALDGHLVADLLGPGHYATMGGADPLDPRLVNAQNTLFEVNYETGTWKVLSTLVHPRTDGRSVTTDTLRNLDVRHAGGRTYLIDHGRQMDVIFLMDEATRSGKPVAALGNHDTAALIGLDPSAFPVEQQAEAKKRLTGHWQWVDRNQDGRVDLDELTEASRVDWGLYWGSWIDNDMTVWSASLYGSGSIYRIPVTQWLPSGAPVYQDPSKQSPLFKAYGNTVVSVMPDQRGSTVFVLERKRTVAPARWEAISRYALDGKRLWSFRPTWTDFALDAPLWRPGYVIGAFKFIGSVSLADGAEIIGVNGYYGQFSLVSSDGLWVAALGTDTRTGPIADQDSIWCENFSGTLFRNRENGKVYLMGGETDLRIWEVTGLGSIRNGKKDFDLSADDARIAASNVSTATQVATASIHARSFKPTIDGSPADWASDSGVMIDGGEGRRGVVHLAYDRDNLYVMADVDDASPWMNEGRDYGLLFATGDSINVMLSSPQPTRIVLAPMNGETAAVLYRSAQGKPGESRTFSSPTGSIDFASVALSKAAKIVVKRGAGHYTLEASIPWDEIGMHPGKGTVAIGDVGIIFSDAAGRKSVRRTYYYDHETSIINDIPSEARLAPARWGNITFE